MSDIGGKRPDRQNSISGVRERVTAEHAAVAAAQSGAEPVEAAATDSTLLQSLMLHLVKIVLQKVHLPRTVAAVRVVVPGPEGESDVVNR